MRRAGRLFGVALLMALAVALGWHFRGIHAVRAWGLAAGAVVALVVAFRLIRFARLHKARALSLAIAGVILFPFAWHEVGVHHWFAPPDPYGPCPPPTQYHSGWLPLNGYGAADGSPDESAPVGQAGVIVYHGWVEVSGCGMSIHMSTG